MSGLFLVMGIAVGLTGRLGITGTAEGFVEGFKSMALAALIIFDGNLQSLVADFAYTEVQGRALSVCSPGIVEALRKVYDAKALADELTRGSRR